MCEDLSFKGGDPGAVKYGNFINYYDFHPTDSRLNCLPSHMWKSLKIKADKCIALDVGCNCGKLTVDLHSCLMTKAIWRSISILGIDLDQTLIDRANELKNRDVSFKCVNIMSENSEAIINEYLNQFQKKQFNMIFCFSITMWIHLNYGDDGLKDFLLRLCKKCEVLVIEPQPWKCYKYAVIRLKKNTEDSVPFPLYSELKIQQNVEKEIENIILSTGTFTKVFETGPSRWGRTTIIFQVKK